MSFNDYIYWQTLQETGKTPEEIYEYEHPEVVRCKECKHNPWNADADYTCIWDDDFADREQTPDDFCSYGEREGE